MTSRAPGPWTLRPMGHADLDFVVAQHLVAFPDGFFARLGKGFMTEYYSAFVTSEVAYGWVGAQDGEPVGYLVGTIDPGLHRHHVVRCHGRRLAVAALRSMVSKPQLARTFCRTRLRLYSAKLTRFPPRRNSQGGVTHHGGRVGVLAHVVVAERARATGLGRALVEEFVRAAWQADCERVLLVTRTEGGGSSFYIRLGWRCVGVHRTIDGVSVTTFEKSSPGAEGPQ